MPPKKKSSLGPYTASAIRLRLKRKQETSLEREYRLAKNRERAAARREYETAEEREYRREMDRVRMAARRKYKKRELHLFWNRVQREIEAQGAESDVLEQEEQAESVLPDVPIMPNLDFVKKEPIDYTEEILPFASQNISVLQNSTSFLLPMKFEPPDDCVDNMTIPVNPDEIALSETSTDTGESSSTLTPHAGTEPSPKKLNFSLSPFTSNTEIKDQFSVFGHFVAAKIRSFTDRCLQTEAQHRITNMLLEVDMKNLNEVSLPVVRQ